MAPKGVGKKNGKKGAGASKEAQKINKATPKAVAKAAPKGAAKAAPKGAAKAAPKENTASIEENTSVSEILAVRKRKMYNEKEK